MGVPGAGCVWRQAFGWGPMSTRDKDVIPPETGARRAIYSAAAVERMLGVDGDTIDQWQTRYGLPVPPRSPGGQVLYSRDDLERLYLVARELAAGHDPASAVARSETRLPANSDDPAASSDRPQLLVLLAERDPRAADLEEYFLRTEGYAVEVAFSADTALAHATSRPDVVIVELSLSGHSVDLCQQLKKVAETPVVAVSSLDRREEVLAGGVDAFLLRPIDPLVLVSTVKDLLGESAIVRDMGGG